jgi:hypothetical protein
MNLRVGEPTVKSYDQDMHCQIPRALQDSRTANMLLIYDLKDL